MVLVISAPAEGSTARQAGDEAVSTYPAPLQPTQYGIRLTPAIARSMSRLAIQHNLAGDLGLSDDQVRALSESSGRHLMEMGHTHGEAIGGMVEHFIQSAMVSQGRFDPDTAREFAERTLPVMPAYSRMLDNFTRDARSILSDTQMQGFEDWMRDYREEVEAFEKRMERWRAGDAHEGENPFAPSPVPEERPGVQSEKTATERHLQRARHYARWEMRRIGPVPWKRFLAHAQRFFDFNEAQVSRANALLEEYTGRFDKLTTDEWRSRFEKNRILSRMKWSMRDLSQGPWAYHIDREYEELMLPIEQLGEAFRGDVLALTTGEQREQALQKLKHKADLHGMTPETWAEMESLLMSIAPEPTRLDMPDRNGGS